MKKLKKKVGKQVKKAEYEAIDLITEGNSPYSLSNTKRLRITVGFLVYYAVVLVVMLVLAVTAVLPSWNYTYQFVGSWIHYTGPNWETYCSFWNCRGVRQTSTVHYQNGQVEFASIDGDPNSYYNLLTPDTSFLLCDNCAPPYQVVQSLFLNRILNISLIIGYICAFIALFVVLVWAILPLLAGKYKKYVKGTILAKHVVLVLISLILTGIPLVLLGYMALYRPFALYDGSNDTRYSFGISFYVMVVNGIFSLIFVFFIPLCCTFVVNTDPMLMMVKNN